jgi:hypothetical protein
MTAQVRNWTITDAGQKTSLSVCVVCSASATVSTDAQMRS